MDLNNLSEADTKEKLIKPKLINAGWGENNIIREYPIKNKYRYYIAGDEYKKIEIKNRFADYVLKVNNIIVGVIEAKKYKKDAEKGLSQAKEYSKMLDVPIAYATNGRKIIVYDRRTKETKEVDEFLSPNKLYTIYKEWKGLEYKDISPLEFPYYIDSNTNKKVRSYQETAIKKVIESILKGQKRILLTMATGTGKTFTSFQIVWKLIKSNYISRVLFLTDRVFLREQAHDKDYEPFKDARYQIKSGNFNKNRKIYFSTYQTLYSNDSYKKIPEDFFDLIIIDECHRSGYGEWRNILEHFKNAYQLGMTATPKREDNIDVYEYFGEPVFTYSMAQAIEDGYLVPYKIHKIFTNIDLNGVDISQAEEVIYDDELNEIEDIKDYYEPSEFEINIHLPDRTKLMCEKLLEILKRTNDSQKTVIFCVDTTHAENIRSTLNQITNNEEFATKIVYEDKDDLERFRDNENLYPQIATTVDLLSTGIDIPHLKNIVFMRPINSRVLFKQIIGRGARLSDNKGFFRIIDFTNATRLIDKWEIPSLITPPDEETPEKPYNKLLKGFVIDKNTKEPIIDAKVIIKIERFKKEALSKKSGYFELNELPSNNFLPLAISKEGYRTLKKKINLKDLKDIENPIFELKPIKKKPKTITVRSIIVEIAEEIDIEFDGNKISFAEYKQYTKEHILKEVHTTEDLKNLWINDSLRKEFLNKLKEKNIDIELIKKLENKLDYDTFDIIAHLVFDAPLLTKDERVIYFINAHIHHINKYGDDIREIAFSLLEKYKKGGIENISTNALKTPDMKRKNALIKLKNALGLKIPKFLNYIKKHIYDSEIYIKTD